MKAKYLFCLDKYSAIEEYYFNQYGCGFYFVLQAIDNSFENHLRHPILENDVIICKAKGKPVKQIYDICDRLKVEDFGEVVSISKDIGL